jgi:hypothetical protein
VTKNLEVIVYKKRLVFVVIALLLSTSISYGVPPVKKKTISPASSAVAPYILTEKEMPDMELTWQTSISWQVEGEDGRKYSPPSVRQEWTCEDGFSIYINYYVLRSKDDLYNNIETHPLMVHGQWHEGSFTGASVGDISWVANEKKGCKFILAAKGRYLVMVETECSWMTTQVNLDGAVLEGIAQSVLRKIPG